MTAMDSSAPAAPRVCPSIDLLAVTATLGAWSPKIVRIAWSSALSPSGVEVAWAFTWSTSRRLEPGLLDRPPGGPDRPDPAGRREGDVRGVRRRPVADDLGQRLRAPRPGVLERLEDDDAGALADDEAVAVLVERARGAPGIVVPGGERLHRGEAADDGLVDAGLDAAGEHDVGVAAPDRLPGLADGMGAGGAGGDGRPVGPERPELDRDLARRHVRDAHRDEERADAVGAPLGHRRGRCRRGSRRRRGRSPR